MNFDVSILVFLVFFPGVSGIPFFLKNQLTDWPEAIKAYDTPMSNLADDVVQAAVALRDVTDQMAFADPVHYVYNPLAYAWESHKIYLERYAASSKKVLFLGMNPGPFGMAQTGVPFGEIAAVVDWLKIDASVAKIGKPPSVHPKRPVEGFECSRSEVSGRRLWGMFGEQFGTAKAFFKDHFVVNYCPLAFMEESGRNRTPNQLPAGEAGPLFDVCNAHLAKLVKILEPRWVIGIGVFAETQAKKALASCPHDVRFGRILHPSPASPMANKGWPHQAVEQLETLKIW